MRTSFISFFFLFGIALTSAFQLKADVQEKRPKASSNPWSSSSEEARHRHRPKGWGPKPRSWPPVWPPYRPPSKPATRPPQQPPVRDTPISCPSDWMTFNRPQGTWCIKVFYNPSNQTQAEQGCKNMGSTLSGVQTKEEGKAIANAARVLVNQYGGGMGETWLGARRKSSCPVRASCAQMSTFEWTDKHTTGIEGFKWGNNEPNGWILPTPEDPRPFGQQYCLASEVHPYSDNSPVVFGFWHGDMDDKHCQDTFKTYACGRKL